MQSRHHVNRQEGWNETCWLHMIPKERHNLHSKTLLPILTRDVVAVAMFQGRGVCLPLVFWVSSSSPSVPVPQLMKLNWLSLEKTSFFLISYSLLDPNLPSSFPSWALGVLSQAFSHTVCLSISSPDWRLVGRPRLIHFSPTVLHRAYCRTGCLWSVLADLISVR